ncbi:MAG: cell division protein FtsL [Bacillota bacterium]|nr:cell division protein FtsL [Bacillota bacterium]
MILAQEKYAVNHSKQIKGVSTNKQKQVKRPIIKYVLVGLVLCAFSLGILLTAQYAKIAAAGFEIIQLKQDIAALETSNERLYLELLQKQSLNRIEAIATAELGMIYLNPSEKQQLALAHNTDQDFQPWFIEEKYANTNMILVEQNVTKINPIIQAITQVIGLR